MHVVYCAVNVFMSVSLFEINMQIALLQNSNRESSAFNLKPFICSRRDARGENLSKCESLLAITTMLTNFSAQRFRAPLDPRKDKALPFQGNFIITFSKLDKFCRNRDVDLDPLIPGFMVHSCSVLLLPLVSLSARIWSIVALPIRIGCGIIPLFVGFAQRIIDWFSLPLIYGVHVCPCLLYIPALRGD